MPDLKNDAPETQTIVRPIVRPASESPGGAGAGGSPRRWIAGSTLAVLALLVAGAFVFLPRFAPPPPALPVPPASPPKAEPAPPPPLTAADYLKQAEAMVAADKEKEAAARRAARRKEEEARQARAQEEARKAAERARIAEEKFAAAISQGMHLLTEEKASAARAAFNRAAQIRPGAPQVESGLAQAAQIEQRQQIAALRKRAEGFERVERWSAALADYEAALKLDSALEFAATGRDRVQPRATLAREFEQLIANPDRLFSAPVRTQAHALISQGKKISASGPVLRQQIEKLTALLAQAETPVRVALESDSATEVTINRVARLGAFSRREVELLPGNYTVVGTRPGYRDVRRELAVLPGKTLAPLVVRCEENI